MRIEERIELYLTESRENEYKDWFKSVKSANTEAELDRAVELAKQYYKKYGENWFAHTFFSDEQTKPTGKLWNKMIDVIKNKKDSLSNHEKKQFIDNRM